MNAQEMLDTIIAAAQLYENAAHLIDIFAADGRNPEETITRLRQDAERTLRNREGWLELRADPDDDAGEPYVAGNMHKVERDIRIHRQFLALLTTAESP